MDVNKLVEFLYSSNTSEAVPFRISLISGQYSGFNLNREQCKALLELLTNPLNYDKEKFKQFLEGWIYLERGENE